MLAGYSLYGRPLTLQKRGTPRSATATSASRSRPAANVEQLIGTTRGCQIGEPIGQRLEQPSEHLGRNPRVMRRTVPALSLLFGVIDQLSALERLAEDRSEATTAFIVTNDSGVEPVVVNWWAACCCSPTLERCHRIADVRDRNLTVPARATTP